MAGVDTATRPVDALPSISHLEFNKATTDRPDNPKLGVMNGLSLSAASLASLSTLYSSAPPPPYSYAPSSGASASGMQGYISPRESTTRRPVRDDKDSPTRKSLPSIHEALGAPLSAATQHPPVSGPSTAVAQNFPDGPTGPSNPFSQPPPTFRDGIFTSQPPSASLSAESQPKPPHLQAFTQPPSPHSNGPPPFRSSSLVNSTFNGHSEQPPQRSPQQAESSQHSHSYSSQISSAPAPYSTEPYLFTAGSKPQEKVPPFQRTSEPYGDTVKRHLEIFDAEAGLNEIGDASARTLDFSRIWAQRRHQGNRTGYFPETLPGIHEIEDMIRQSHRVLDNLTHLKEVVVQQAVVSEHRARMARGSHLNEEYADISEEYKGAGGFASGDSKKRRGKAAPPGRCHSCNRAETPEWRRGPDGARTLCNACGLHYAKLTRKIGLNKAAAITGSNLRPKNLDQRV
ncbi:hypothetical protein DV736_g1104, partial [Chaetothyriales sp. CBS 134916]